MGTSSSESSSSDEDIEIFRGVCDPSFVSNYTKSKSNGNVASQLEARKESTGDSEIDLAVCEIQSNILNTGEWFIY